MNTVILTGRLTKDPEIRQASTTTIATFTLAVDRVGKEKQADFPRVTAFGKTAENVGRFLKKGCRAGVQGRLQTGSYERNGQSVFTTDVIAERVEFIDFGEKMATRAAESVPEGFHALDEEVPF